ncbi:MAG: phosphate starvation-inducible protein PhoH [Crocinitomicaceae bacterium]|nr:phosphate starvation-inducible protein PhoH [Crocinitomicaceae bacterium]
MPQNKINISRSIQNEILGNQNKNLELLKLKFPKLKIILRDEYLNIIGDQSNLDSFLKIWTLIKSHHSQFNSVSETILESIINEKYKFDFSKFNKKNIILYGNKGKVISARTINQYNMVKGVEKNDLLFAVGPAGSGKTYTAVAIAVKALKEKRVQKIILTRPAVEAGENLGFLPGDLKEKLDPYLQPLYDALVDMLPSQKLLDYLDEKIIQIAPLGFMRGRTLDNAFVILDEGQNTTENQLKMFLTRMGKSAKFIVTGDVTQIDLPKNQKSGLKKALNLFNDVKGIELVTLNEEDVVRHPLVKKIIKVFK